MRIKYFTEKGKRKANEDYILSKSIDDNISLHIIADGMGGYENGNIASETVAKFLFDSISKNSSNLKYKALIGESIYKANNKISEINIRQNTKMGTTIAGVLIDKSKAYLFWVGDVKIIHIRDKKVIFESKDHSLLNQLKDNNSFTDKLDYSKIRHIVTRSLHGTNNKSKPDFHFVGLLTNDKIIICSDGILDRESINVLSKLKIDNLANFSKRFVDGRDNASLIIIEY